MKTLYRLWTESSKKLRFLLNVLIICLLIFAIYTFISAPPFTEEIRFRRIEKANLVGPSEILGTLERNFSQYDRFLLADDGEGVIICAENSQLPEPPELIWREKTGPLTVLGAPDPTPFDELDPTRSMTIFAFDSWPEAVKAEMELTLMAEYKGEAFEKTYTLKASREIPGVFRFTLHTLNRWGLGPEGYAMQIFTLISGYGGKNFSEYAFPVTVRFYDAEGILIAEESTTVISAAAQAQNP